MRFTNEIYPLSGKVVELYCFKYRNYKICLKHQIINFFKYN